MVPSNRRSAYCRPKISLALMRTRLSSPSLRRDASMLRRLTYLSAICFWICAPACADDLPAQPAAAVCAPVRTGHSVHPIRHRYGKAATYRAASEIAQIHVDGCWQYQPIYDGAGDYYGRQLVKVCIDLPPN